MRADLFIKLILQVERCDNRLVLADNVLTKLSGIDNNFAIKANEDLVKCVDDQPIALKEGRCDCIWVQ